ncbi:MAG: 5-oxoprolinase subunit PxpB [Chloroflexi bacterium]|nr:5-oxoprolinase subunit PxpB [Chloroflexota bacterium]
MNNGSPHFLAGGDSAIFVEFGNTVSLELNQRVHNLKLAIQRQRVPGIIETVPAYCSLLVYFDPLQIHPDKLRQTLRRLVDQPQESTISRPRLIEIPTAYGGDFGPDIEFIAKHNGLSVDEVIKIHTGTHYPIYMIGFMPGFPYLGGMSPSIAAPRLETPRSKIPAGSVGIAGTQTGIYPVESPGGWRLIGRTPFRIFDPSREPPSVFQAGDYLKFVSISPDEFASIQAKIEQGTYAVKLNSI